MKRDEAEGLRIPVLIVGAGPIGMIAAILLSQLQVPSLVIDRRSGVSNHPKARGFNVRTMEIFRECGIEALVRGSQPDPARVRNFAVGRSLADPDLELHPFHIGDLEPTAFSPCTGTVGSQDGLEVALLHAVRQQARTTIWHGCEATAVVEGGDAVTVTVTDSAGRERRIIADYVVAADGARSPMRDRLGISFEGSAAIAHNLNVMFEADLAEKMAALSAVFVITRDDDGGTLPAALSGVPTWRNANEWTYNFQVPADQVQAMAGDSQALRARVSRAIGDDRLPIRITGVSPWQTSALVAGEWRKGRVFLAGDAAHLMPPAGGLGLNTGAMDIHNLAWRIAHVLHGIAGPELLDDYERERKAAASDIVDIAVGNLASSGGGRGPTGIWSGPHHGTVLGFRYRKGSFIAEADAPWPGPGRDYRPDGRPGTRAPHAWVDRRLGLSLLDLTGRKHVLICGSEAHGWRNAAESTALARSGWLRIHQISGELAAGGWSELYGVDASGATLIRPDGIIAWRSIGESSTAQATLADVLGRLLRSDTVT